MDVGQARWLDRLEIAHRSRRIGGGCRLSARRLVSGGRRLVALVRLLWFWSCGALGRLLLGDDDRPLHLRVKPAVVGEGSRLVERLAELLARIETAGIERPVVGGDRVRPAPGIGPGHGRTGRHGERPGFEGEVDHLHVEGGVLVGRDRTDPRQKRAARHEHGERHGQNRCRPTRLQAWARDVRVPCSTFTCIMAHAPLEYRHILAPGDRGAMGAFLTRWIEVAAKTKPRRLGPCLPLSAHPHRFNTGEPKMAMTSALVFFAKFAKFAKFDFLAAAFTPPCGVATHLRQLSNSGPLHLTSLPCASLSH